MTKIFATLVRGQNYFLGNDHFKANEPKVVTEEQRRHLIENAVDPVSIRGNNPDDSDDVETELRQKFEFVEGDAPPKPAPATRTRTRPARAAA